MTETEKLHERITALEAQIVLYRERHESVSNDLARLQEAHDLRQGENRGWLQIYLQLLSDLEALKADVSRLEPQTESDSRDVSVRSKELIN
jgi:predicted nuclease with TOPRIM domain